MTKLTIRNVPDDLHIWLKQQAAANRSSLNREVILQLEALRSNGVGASDAAQRLARIRAIAKRSAALPVLDSRPEAEILGLGPTPQAVGNT